MLAARYWSRAEGSTLDPKGKRYRLQLWGWSEESPAAALERARQRLSEALARVGRGELERGGYLYGAQPLREEILRRLGEAGRPGEAVVTRNRYGAQVLCTARVPFIDVDSPQPGLWSRLARLLRRGAPPDPTLERLREAGRRYADRAFRLYRTPAGYRVLATDWLLDPSSEEAQQLLGDFGADPCFRRLCRLQQSFRARLTAKPWRCGLPLPPGRHPREDPDLARRFEDWLARYEARAAGFAGCRYLESLGPDATCREARPIVEEHDRAAGALSELPLA